MKIHLAILAALISTNAFAIEQTVPAATSQSESASFIPKQVYSDIFSNYHGSSLKEFDSSRSMDRFGKLGKPATTNFDSEFAAGYRLTDSVKIGAVVPFLAFPSSTANSNFSLGDVGLKISHSDTIDYNGLKLSTNLIIQAANSDYSKARGQGLAFKTTPYVRYEIGKTDFSVGAFNELKYYSGVTSGKSFKVWTLPYARYRLNKSVSFNLGYELEMDHMVHNPARLSHYQHDLQPSVMWNITKHIMVQPYLQLFSLNKINTANTGFGTLISAAIL
jgi:hypothetical protein